MRASIVYFSILASLVASANALEIAPARRGVAILSRNNDVDRVDKVDVDRRSGVDKVDVDKRSAISIDFFEPTPSVISAASLESAFGTTSWAVISPAPAPTNNPANVD
ncbi:hypothetical protein C361_06725 [Cryptococcus neoformans Tu259-1]|uniref:Uncharacterized protein n=1 Tax=Cryptococcus neoformans Tu259-1 TaxID=1230072 RepID=A0A854Q852_CRYNE|nr:hypothetical protein C361_06725 [Cryptococcus neoformans var. grubii Tu259-1]